LVTWLRDSKASLPTLHICMEATGVYYEAIATTLHAEGFKVSVVNPACIKGFGLARTSATRTTKSTLVLSRATARR